MFNDYPEVFAGIDREQVYVWMQRKPTKGKGVVDYEGISRPRNGYLIIEDISEGIQIMSNARYKAITDEIKELQMKVNFERES